MKARIGSPVVISHDSVGMNESEFCPLTTWFCIMLKRSYHANAHGESFEVDDVPERLYYTMYNCPKCGEQVAFEYDMLGPPSCDGKCKKCGALLDYPSRCEVHAKKAAELAREERDMLRWIERGGKR